MTATVEETDQSTDLSAFEKPTPPCDYSMHDQYGDGPAVWIIRFKDPAVCGCKPRVNPALFCNGCWVARSSRATTYCTHCSSVAPAADNVVSVERL